MTRGDLAIVFFVGLIAIAMGVDAMRMRKRSGMTRKEVWRYDSGYMLGGKLFFVIGLTLSALSGIGLILKVFNVW